jgi:hypothetical protein
MEKKDYSCNLPDLTEESAVRTVIDRAKRVIRLLSLNADRVVECTYTLGSERVTLPSAYYFGNVPVYFLPGWGQYFIGDNRTTSIALKLPNGHDELIEDIEKATAFLGRFGTLSRKAEKERVEKQWRQNMKERMN